MKADAVIIGGGASGTLCAGLAAGRGLSVVLLEPNRMLGRKLRITGKGRCNVTNDCDAREFISAIPGDGRFLQSAIHRFGTSDTKALFEGLGVALKTERGNRVFPESDKADDIADALAELARKNGVRVLRERARHILTDESGAVCAVATERGEIECANAVICTGGLSYPGTGSTGDGYRMAQELGHTIRTCRPSLVPLESPDKWCREMQGFSLRNVELYAYEDDKLIYKALGEMLFTHFGVSGPLVLSASAHMRRFGECKYRLSIDLKPGLDDKRLDARLLRDFEKYNNREFRNSLGDLAGRMMIPVLVELSGIPGDTRTNSVTKQQRAALASLLKHFPVAISGPRPIAEAIVTSGGVATTEVNPRTMESKLVPGLHFAGEVLDLDAYTGGYNLQIAWSTAFVAANSLHQGCEDG